MLVGLGCLSTLVACKDAVVVDPIPVEEDGSAIGVENKLTKLVYKSIVLTGPRVGVETFENDGKMYTVAQKHTIDYNYDAQGRISKELKTALNGDSILTVYEYQNNRILVQVNYSFTNPFKLPSFSRDTIQLNEQGLAVIAMDKIQVTYNSSGYITNKKSRYGSSTYTILKNNVISIEEYNGYGHAIYTQKFDTNRVNRQPNTFSFSGKKDKNIIIQNTLDIKESPYYANVKAYQIDFLYSWDGYGRIVRQLKIGKRLPDSNWPFEEDTYGVGVYYYYYK